MRRFCLMIALLFLLQAVPGLCEAPEAPALTLPSATSVEEVESFLIMPRKFALSSAKKGYLRYISQNESQDPNFRASYWLGGPLGSELDLTLKKKNGREFAYHAGTMCSRAAYSMALSYLGIDLTPGAMSKLMNQRDLAEPYDMISELVGVERISEENEPNLAAAFQSMMDNYLTDPSYSPIYLYFLRPNGSTHAVLVVATIPEKNRYLVVDTNALSSGGKLHRVYFISLNPQRSRIVNSTFYDRLQGSRVLQLDQWRLVEEAQN